jgi:hypothetical protein
MKGLATCAVLIAMLGTRAVMAGPFDGNWIGQIPPAGPCRGMATMTITVSGSSVSGLMHNSPRNIRAFKGTIDADGNATFTTELGHPGTIKFSVDHFDANWTSGDCQRHSLGDRAPDTTQIAALIAHRNQGQAAYDALTARAAAGDKSVDFTLLRSNFPFTRQWDADDSNVAPILEQARIAATGKDCGTALEKLDEVLKADYTLIAAHRLRADCLNGDAARVESRIADALLHSLTRGGDGRSETSAYPVMSRHEETDLLADQHIVLKTRDVEVRGSNGRYYDVVHGLSVLYGLNVRDVYFDVSAEVAGRNSAMAAKDAAATPVALQ